ncbi:unnamed protein product [Calypogeia fissa]
MGWMSNKPAVPTIDGNAPPQDVYGLAYIVYFSLGAGFLLPWNSFITAVDYFDYLYPNTHIDRVFGVSYIFPCFIVLCYMSLYGQRYGSWIRINTGLVIFLVCMVLVPTLDAIFIKEDTIGSTGTFYVTVGALVVTGIADALVQGSLIGSAGQLPSRYMQALVSGTAASGVLVSGLRIVTKAALPQTPRGLRLSGDVYFAVSAAFLAFCLVAFNWVHKLPVMVHYQKENARRLKTPLTNAETEPLTSPQDLEGDVSASDSLGFPSLGGGIIEDKGSFKHVLGQLKWFAGSMILIYIITLSIFPGFVSEDVHSASLGDWYPVILMASYNLCDLFGKHLTTVYIPDNKSVMIGGSVGRLLFIPLFAACLHGPQIFRTEAPVFFLTSLLGVTNGYLTACLFIRSPQIVPLAEGETAGIVMTIALVLGLAIGSVVSWFWVV